MSWIDLYNEMINGDNLGYFNKGKYFQLIKITQDVNNIEELRKKVEEFKNVEFNNWHTFQKLSARFETPTSLLNFINIEFYKIYNDFTKSDKLFFFCVFFVAMHKMYKDTMQSLLISKGSDEPYSFQFFEIVTRYLKKVNDYLFKYYEDINEIFSRVIGNFEGYFARFFIGVENFREIFKCEIDKINALKTLSGVNLEELKKYIKLMPYFYIFIKCFYNNNFNNFFNSFIMSVDRKGKNPDRGCVVTPTELSDLIFELIKNYAEIKKFYYVNIIKKKKTYKQFNFYIFDPLAGGGSIFVDFFRQSFKNDVEGVNFKGFANDYNRGFFIVLLSNIILNFPMYEINHKLRVMFNNYLNFSTTELIGIIKESYNSRQFFLSFLNPPYEEEFKPAEIIKKTFEVTQFFRGLMVLLIPNIKLIMHPDLNELLKEWEVFRIKVQTNIFKDSGVAPNDGFSRDEKSRGIFLIFYDFSGENLKNLKMQPLEFDFSDYLKSLTGRKGWIFDGETQNKRDKFLRFFIDSILDLQRRRIFHMNEEFELERMMRLEEEAKIKKEKEKENEKSQNIGSNSGQN